MAGNGKLTKYPKLVKSWVIQKNLQYYLTKQALFLTIL